MMLSKRLKELREAKGLLQRQVAHILDVDTAYVSKMENNEKPVSRNRLKELCEIYDADEKELQLLWMSDKVFDTVKDEAYNLECLELTMSRIKNM